VLFSIVPLVILTVSILGFFLNSQDLRDEIVTRVLDIVPLNETDGRAAVETALNNVKSVSGPVAAFGLIGTAWTASAVFASIRKALNRVGAPRSTGPSYNRSWSTSPRSGCSDRSCCRRSS
jgi:uncharacterized BrkB/YihY/UPF0761 family membrane protein